MGFRWDSSEGESMNHSYGWKRDLPDYRDSKFKFSFLKRGISIPDEIDLREDMPPIYDQGELGSCTANALAAIIDYNRIKQGEVPIWPSRLFIYYNEREMEGTIYSDSGAAIRDGIKSVATTGVCPEVEWPYDIPKYQTVPLAKCYDEARLYKSVLYHRVPQNIESIKEVLASGFPIVFGFSVTDSFESTGSDGIVPPISGNILGGHAVCCAGYTLDHWIIRNSWGENAGDKGYYYMPWEYVTNPDISSDLWTMTLVS